MTIFFYAAHDLRGFRRVSYFRSQQDTLQYLKWKIAKSNHFFQLPFEMHHWICYFPQHTGLSCQENVEAKMENHWQWLDRSLPDEEIRWWAVQVSPLRSEDKHKQAGSICSTCHCLLPPASDMLICNTSCWQSCSSHYSQLTIEPLGFQPASAAYCSAAKRLTLLMQHMLLSAVSASGYIWPAHSASSITSLVFSCSYQTVDFREKAMVQQCITLRFIVMKEPLLEAAHSRHIGDWE